MGNKSGRHYCGIYDFRPHDCGAFTPIGCEDVDADLPRAGQYKVGRAYEPKRRPARAPGRMNGAAKNGRTPT
jgi:hypothetical protein